MTGRRPEPVRTCVGCRSAAGKRGLLRLVRPPQGGIVFDPTGKAPGRGAYLHPDAACWEVALERGALGRALRTGLSPDEAGTLLTALQEATSQ